MSERQHVMAEHSRYLSNLVDDGKVLLAGPCFEAPPVLWTGKEASAS